MNYRVHIINKDENEIYYISYDNGKSIELTRNYCHRIICSEKHIFLLLNNDSNESILDKVFDINNKRFLTKKIEMQILYNNYRDNLNKRKKLLAKQNKELPI